MKVFVAGATGVLGRALVPQLVARGHEVVGMTRSASKQDLVGSLGARPVVADALDPDAVAQAVASAEPEVIVHQLTALSGEMSMKDARHPDRSSAAIMTNRLRTEGTDHLLAAGRAVGARRFVAQSFGAFRYARTGGPVQTEADPLDPDPPAPLRPVVEGLLYLERAVTTIEWGEGLALRYGGFYGPGTGISLASDAQMAAPIRKRRFPIVGDGGGVMSHVHIDDAAAATVAAVEHGQPGIYNVVDDDPAPVREWLPMLASALDAKPPRHIPRWLGRLLAGEAATVMMTEVRGASNAKAKRELGWQLAARSINKYLLALDAIFKRAQRHYGLTVDPVAGVDRQPVRRSTEFRVLSPEAVEALCRAAREGRHRTAPKHTTGPEWQAQQRHQDLQDAAIFAVAAYAGLRLGEIRGLRWRDVDFAKRLIHVRRAFTQGSGDIPKSGRARAVPMIDQTARVLDELSRRDCHIGEDDLVFVSPDGSYLEDSALRRRFYGALKAAKIKHLRFHDLRHSFGTLAVQVFPLSAVKAYMGHADIATTMIYVHHVPQHDAAAKLSAAVTQAASTGGLGVDPAKLADAA